MTSESGSEVTASSLESGAVDRSAAKISRRRMLGAYYTSDEVARIVVRWALNGTTTSVLDPSFGGCSFLRMAIEELEALGCDDAPTRVYGADIDPGTARWSARLANRGVPVKNLPLADFLSIRPGELLPRCGAVVGNPPYVRHHWLQEEFQRQVDDLRRCSGISKRASAWAYFVLNGIDFVSPGGRMAMLLPGSVLQADYASSVRRVLSKAFCQIEFVRVRERLFDAAEETVILLASGRLKAAASSRPTPRPIQVRAVESVSELAQYLESGASVESVKIDAPERLESLDIADYKLALLMGCSSEMLGIMEAVLCDSDTHRLGQIGDVRIGTVTGSNAFFIRDRADIPEEPGVKAVPVVRRGAWIRGMRWMASDHHTAARTHGRAHLLVADRELDLALAPKFLQLVTNAEADGLDQSRHCSRRDPWWALTDVRPGHVLFSYMGATSPRVVVNTYRAACTNAVHRVFVKMSPRRSYADAIAASSSSSVFQLFSEVLGRHYGGGVLKLEPSRAASLPIFLWLRDSELIARVEGELALRGQSAARDLVDAEFCRRIGLSAREVGLIREGARLLRRQRALN